MWRWCLIGNHCLAQAHCHTGCAALHIGGWWWRWIPTGTTCVWRCIAVHRGARPDWSTRAIRELVKRFLKLRTVSHGYPWTALGELGEVEIHLNRGAPVLNCLTEEHSDNQCLWGACVCYQGCCKAGENVCVFIVRRHHKILQLSATCSKLCPRKDGYPLPGRVEAPQTTYEKAFFSKYSTSKESLLRLSRIAETENSHPSGSVWPRGWEVACGLPSGRVRPRNADCGTHKSAPSGWLHRHGKGSVGRELSEVCKPRTWSNSHAIFFDFESYQDKTRRKHPTLELTIEREHVPISVSIGDTLDRGPTHICNGQPK